MFDLSPQIAVSLFGAGIGLAIWAIASQAHEKSVVRDSLRALEDYEVVQGYVLCCQSYPRTDRLVIAYEH